MRLYGPVSVAPVGWWRATALSPIAGTGPHLSHPFSLLSPLFPQEPWVESHWGHPSRPNHTSRLTPYCDFTFGVSWEWGLVESAVLQMCGQMCGPVLNSIKSFWERKLMEQKKEGDSYCLQTIWNCTVHRKPQSIVLGGSVSGCPSSWLLCFCGRRRIPLSGSGCMCFTQCSSVFTCNCIAACFGGLCWETSLAQTYDLLTDQSQSLLLVYCRSWQCELNDGWAAASTSSVVMMPRLWVSPSSSV